MKLKVFSIFDSKVGAYEQPFTMRTHGEALRSWIQVVNDKTTKFFAHPEDFTLFELAEYDTDTGRFTNTNTPVSHGVAVEFHRSNPQLNIVNPEGVVS